MSVGKVFTSVVVVALLAGGAYYLYQPAAGKPAPVTTAKTTNKPLVLTSPPRESAEKGAEVYGPIAEYLSKVTGRHVVYEHPPTWGLYRTEMLNGNYDIIFDGGHFADYRARRLGYHIVAKMPSLQQFAIIVRKDDHVSSVEQLAGQTFCSPPSPNQGALLALSQFKDPTRQPITVPITSNFWPSVYEGVVAGRCRAGVLVVAILKKLDKDGATRIVMQTPPQPNQAFSVSGRVDAADRAKIAAALIAPEAAKATEKLRERFKVGDSFVAANNAEYVGLGDLLKNEFGFESIASN